MVLLDGAVGTTLWALADARGIKRVPVWKYNLEQPDMVLKLHEGYIEAGSQMILTNTFGANRQMVNKASDYDPEEVVRAGVRLAKQAAFGKDVQVLCACGPLLDFMDPYGDLEEEEVEDIYELLIGTAVKEGVDGVMVQTFMDLDTMCVACRVAKNHNLPLYATMTFEKSGKTMMGHSVQKVCAALEEAGADAVGMNCSLGPEMAMPIIREFKAHTKLPLVFKPNAGMPMTAAGSDAGAYSAEMFLSEVRPALEFVDYIGGCCNSDFAYIRLLKQAIDEKR